MPLYDVLTSTQRRALQAEYELLQYRALVVCKAMNAGNIVAILPEHILVMIFQLYATDSRRPGSHGWLAVAWVCSRWRTIVLHAATLWKRIPVAELTAVEFYLDHARTLPLHITGKLSGVPREWPELQELRNEFIRNIEAWSKVLTHAARIEGLEIDHDFRLGERRLCMSGLQYATFPKLRRFAIEGHHIRELHPIRNQAQIPALLRGYDEMQLLEEVTTTNIPLSLVANLFSANLKKLDIGKSAHSRTSKAWSLPWDAFFSKLRLLSGLQELTLGCFPSLSADAARPHSPLTLPALTLLTLRMHGADIALEAAHFLTNTALPAHCALRVSHTGTGTTRAFDTLCSAVADTLSTPAEPLRTLMIAEVGGGTVQLVCWTAEIAPAEIVMRPVPQVPLLVMTVHDTLEPRLAKLLRRLPLQTVVGAALCDASGGLWGEDSSGIHTEGVRTLLVTKRAAHDVTRALGRSSSTRFPALKLLIFGHLRPIDDGVEWARQLRTRLLERREQMPDAPPLRLFVDDPELHCTSKWMELIKPVVHRVRYNVRPM
ncbi:hypothetical protein PsYK624_034410 [Phanerochaete sordida]|uniref:F-box domain-containing protein n=1 Tax=Phanerochaete sordida TaxID=48140 RepID=A0A9P3LAV1_9APHY|nr:hypothetical protein PsYK624_034410 [Phanerochaete sordida]